MKRVRCLCFFSLSNNHRQHRPSSSIVVWGKKIFYLKKRFFSCVVKINKIIYCYSSQCSAPCSSLKSYKWNILCFSKCSKFLWGFMIDFFHTWREKKLLLINCRENVYSRGIDLFLSLNVWTKCYHMVAVAQSRDESRPWSLILNRKWQILFHSILSRCRSWD